MLLLRYSRDWKFNYSAAVREICGTAGQNCMRRILIVPEQNSFTAESDLCRFGGDEISRCAEVLSFTRLASRVFSVCGGSAVPMLDQSGRLIAMAGALELLRPKLRLFGGSITKPEFLKQLLQIVDEFHACGLNPESVRSALEDLEGPLAEKLSELVLITELYDTVCARAKQDPSTRLTRLRDAIYDGNFADHAQFVVEGFTDFTEQELEVLTALMERADRVSVYLTCDHLDHGQMVFAATRQTAQRLLRCARSRNVPCTSFRLVPPHSDSPMRIISEQLFSPGYTPCQTPTDAIRLLRCATASEECLSAVGVIQRLIRCGSRYREIAVAYTDPGVYAPALKTVLDRFRIPFYASGTKEILSHSMIRGVLFALEAAGCGMEADCVCEYLKSGVAPVSRDMADCVENYAYIWNLHGNRWNGPFTKDPGGPTVDRQADYSQQLTLLNEARQLAIEPLWILKTALYSAENTAQQVLALEAFFEQIGLEQRLGEKSDALSAAGEYQQAQELRQLYEILICTMEQIYGVLGKTIRSPEEFFRFFRAALTQNSVGSIPATLDCVSMGEISAMRHTNVKHMLLLGANDGVFPSFDRSVGLLTQTERRMMKTAGLQVAPDDAERMDRALLTDYDLLTAPSESLFVSCDREAPSYLFLRLEKLFENRLPFKTEPLPASLRQMAALIAAQDRNTAESILRTYPDYQVDTERIRRGSVYTPGTLDRDTVHMLYGRELKLSSSKVDRLASCRYAYYLEFGLGLKELKRADLDPTVYGILVHYVLEHTVRDVQAEGGFRTVSLERTLELCRKHFDIFLNEKLNDLESYSLRGAYLVRRNYREIEQVVRILYQELNGSRFIPVSFEQAFSDDTAIPITGDLSNGILTGVVDRVDLYTARSGKTYLRVIDYKTGKKDFDYTDILSGMGMQMLIYLFALTREAERFYGKKLEPAGVLYVPAKYDVQPTKGRLPLAEAEKERQKKLRRKGLILDDEEILQAMEEGEEPVFLPYRIAKKTGARSGDLANEKQLSMVEQHVSRTLTRLTDELGSGKIEPDPYWRGEENNACRWCAFRAVCRVNSGEVPFRRLRAISQDRFWESLEKEVDRHDG